MYDGALVMVERGGDLRVYATGEADSFAHI